MTKGPSPQNRPIRSRQIFRLLALLLILGFATELLQAQDSVVSLNYKSIGDIQLNLDLHYPPGYETGLKYPTMVFFFGGGWNGGTIEHFRPHAKYFASRGMITAVVDYRVKTRHDTTPFDAVRDAKSAIRFLRKKHEDLGIDPDRIVASGGSAGGHLAAATGNVEGLEEAGEDFSISSKANALVLFNPVYDNGPGQYGYDRIGERYPEISPKHNIRKGAPPTLVLFGTEDHLVDVATINSYDDAMEEVGSICETVLYEGAGHGFFNIKNLEYFRDTVLQSDRFLKSLGYLQGEATLQVAE